MAAAAALPILPPDPATAAREADLRHVRDDAPGIRRVRRGRGFAFVRPDGSRVKDPEEIRRIRALAIPPAWSDVWICPDPRGHLQATGRDARRRKQYRYHDRWRETRDAAKYDRTLAFGEALPALRERVAKDLRRPGLPAKKVVAAVVRLLDETLARVGNPEYARAHGHYGLTTLETRHAEVGRSSVRLRYKGKVGKVHEAKVDDAHLARIVRACADLPGQELFQYEDDAGAPRPIASTDVNEYLRRAAGEAFTAKDFRTWHGSVLAARELSRLPPQASKARRTRQVARALEKVAQRLNNTVAVCRKGYVHPAVLDAHEDGTLRARLDAAAPRHDAEKRYLDADERALLALLRSAA